MEAKLAIMVSVAHEQRLAVVAHALLHQPLEVFGAVNLEEDGK